jgi:type II secretory pathway pseudopilin PulG
MPTPQEDLMPYRFWLKLAAIVIAVALVVAAVQAWRADQRDRAQLAAELAATKQLLTAADARQHDRDTQLAQTLSALAAEKRTVSTPAQIIRELPKNIPLPAPITRQVGHASSVGATLGSPATHTSDTPVGGASPAPTNGKEPPSDGAFIPRADLKPLYDFALDCKACQAKLSAAQNDLADEQKKTAALTLERDQAVQIARGGTTWRRIGRAAKWFLIGAAAGAVASKAAR